MRELTHTLDGSEVRVYRVEREEDLEGFREFIRNNLRAVACDSETTGLNVYGSSFGLRLIQFGTPDEAWVLPVEHGGQFLQDSCRALRGVSRLLFHNAGYDLQVFDHVLGVSLEELWPKVTDTRILAHLVDPRGQEEGGIGHSLEALTKHYIDAETGDSVKGLMASLAKEHKTTKKRIWSEIPLDDEQYNLYAGMDCILTSRIAQKLSPLVPESSVRLISFEHELAEVCSEMERTGFLLDTEYAEKLSEDLREAEERHTATALEWGCENVNATEQVADALEAQGIEISGRTPTGKRKVDKKLLERLTEEGNEFAEAVAEAKKSRKWRTTWVDGFLSQRDTEDRCHPSINPLRARTARMSITGIPAQTLPSGDWIIRRCFVSDYGESIVACDFQAQELRVLAALSGDRRMKDAFSRGADLHQITADAAGVERKVGKTTNFAYVYGSGAKNIADTCNISVPTAKRVVQSFEESYPAVKVLSKKLQAQASAEGFITTPSGRRLPVDPNRAYSSLNYLVQSTSRDVTARALLRLHKEGFTPYLRLPVHDEVIASVPTRFAEWGSKRIASVMEEEFQGVHIGTDAEVYGFSWGHGYMTEEERKRFSVAA